MIKPKKSLLIFSLDKYICKFLRDTLQEVIGHEVKIYAFFMGQKLTKAINPDLIMLSNDEVRQEARRLFPNTPILTPKRIITCFNLEKLLRLPRGHKVLLVNNPRSATEETIESLINFGIDNPTYIPYWVGNRLNLNDIDTAVSPGMTHLVPKQIQNIIDIGPRTISIHSFLRLLIALDLNSAYLERFSNLYHNLLIESSRKLTKALDHSEMLHKHKEVILNVFEDGLLSVNQDGQIDLVNASILKLLNTDRDKLMNKMIDGLIGDFEKLGELVDNSHSGSTSAGIYTYNKRKLLINKIPIVCGKVKSHIYTFREIDRMQKTEENVRIKLAEKGYVTKYKFSDFWSKSKEIEVLVDKARNFAKTEMNILITGESGTGKEMFAHAIHNNSPRRNGPFVAVNFAGLSEGLIESEMFGYEGGAFTGAKRGGKKGLFEQAHGGTIFLDEIGDASLNVQSRLLRVLQEKEIMRVGGSKIVPINVRVVAATNTDLNEALSNGKFREDLYFRINTLPLKIPPIREHREDLLFIINKYLKKKYTITKTMSEDAINCILAYDWPGNIRELINTAEYIRYSSEGKTQVELSHLPDSMRASHEKSTRILLGKEKNDFHKLMSDLSKTNIISEIVYQFLQILNDRKKMGTGRNTLREELLKNNQVVTEGIIRRYLRTLNLKGLVSIGTTKQGTTITKKGEEFLEYWQLPSNDKPQMSRI